MIRRTVCLIGFLLTIPLSVEHTTVCHGYCRCYNATESGICDGKGENDVLHYIPEFPNGTVKITFTNNKLVNLSKETFSNISGLDITSLILINNKIRFIQNDTFSDFKNLTELDLSGNTNMTTKDAAASLHSLPKTIVKLSFNHMLWKPFDELFIGLNGSNITTINLSHSYLTPFNGTWFSHLNSLRRLDISWNSIQDYNYSLTGLEHLTTLSMIGNYFNFIPDFTKYGLCELKTLFLSNSKLSTIEHLRNHSQCLSKLEHLNLNGIAIPVIQDNVFSGLKSLKVLRMQKISTQLKNIRKYAFNSSSLTNLSFSKCDAFFFTNNEVNYSFHPKELFRFTPNLIYLNLSHNVIELNSEKPEIREMFAPLKKLKVLDLQYLSLNVMPRNFFNQFTYLEELWLDYNLLRPWKNGPVFDGLTNLKDLYLKNNKIGMIYPTSFPRNVLDNLHSLDLTNNEFICTCDLMWFRNWMKSTKVHIVGMNEYVCDFRMRLKNFNPTFMECHNVIVITTVSVGSGLSMFLIATITVYCCRWRIRFQLYKIRSRRCKYQELRDRENLKYAAYVIYCYEDLKWIKSKLIPKLEGENRFKICIPHRDFELGKVFADNIVDHMNMSRTVIPVLSNNFSKNEWCLFQLAVARSKLSKEGSVSIFPILLEEIHFKNMNAAIYALIQLSSYAAWSKNEDCLELFWNQVLNNIY